MSALVGAAVVLLAGVLSAQQIANRFVSVRVLETPTLEMAPHARDFVRIVEGTPFAVPAEKILVLTGVGAQNRPGAANSVGEVRINGQAQWAVWVPTNPYHSFPIPVGLRAVAGDSVEAGQDPNVGDQSMVVVVLGYLVDA